MLAAMKVRGLSVYDSQRSLAGHLMPTSVSDVGARHKGYGGGNLRAAVFGVNDGLVSNTSLIMGVAGAAAGADFVLTSGVAGLLAGALSMAAGEYVSMRSQREMFEYQIGLERDELQEYPEEEAEELALIYQARGMQLEEARRVTRELVKNEANALDALAREELGLNPDDLGSPWGAAIYSFLAFCARRDHPAGAVPVRIAAAAVGHDRRDHCGHRVVRCRRRVEPVHGPQRARGRAAHGADRRRRGHRDVAHWLAAGRSDPVGDRG